MSFSYKHGGDGEETLHEIDLHIASGETIGIIGGTGCGKSSLVNLISRLYDVDEGSVKAVSYTHLDVYKRQVIHTGSPLQRHACLPPVHDPIIL